MGLHRQARVRAGHRYVQWRRLFLAQSAVADEADTLNVTAGVTRTYTTTCSAFRTLALDI